jgi:hypothetical protein
MIKRLLFGVALGAALIACTPASPAATTAPPVAAPTEGAPSEAAPTEAAPSEAVPSESMPTESASPAAS